MTSTAAIRVAIINHGTLHISASSFTDLPGESANTTSPAARFVQGDFVIDHARGLMWSRKLLSSERMNFADAEAACKACTLEGHTDWRLPTREELQSLVDYTRLNPAIDTEVFPDTPANYFWSSSPAASAPDYAWVVNFACGHVLLGYRASNAFVRAVRSVPASQ